MVKRNKRIYTKKRNKKSNQKIKNLSLFLYGWLWILR